jgi:hypothetical protein
LDQGKQGESESQQCHLLGPIDDSPLSPVLSEERQQREYPADSYDHDRSEGRGQPLIR